MTKGRTLSRFALAVTMLASVIVVVGALPACSGNVVTSDESPAHDAEMKKVTINVFGMT